MADRFRRWHRHPPPSPRGFSSQHLRHRHRWRLLRGAQDDGRAGARYAFHRLKPVYQDPVQVPRVPAHDLEQVIIFTGHVMTLEDLGKLIHLGQKSTPMAWVLQSDRDEGEHRVADGGRIQESGVSADDTALLELADALRDGGPGDAEESGEGGPGDTPIPLNLAKDGNFHIDSQENIGPHYRFASNPAVPADEAGGTSTGNCISLRYLLVSRESFPSGKQPFMYDLIVLGAGPGGYVAAVRA